MSKIILFDADGVMTIPEDFFSIVYARSHGLDGQPFVDFFGGEWADFVTGKRDIKDHIRDNPDLWQWKGTPDELMDYWCEIEDIRNDEMIDLVKSIRASGTPCYLATEQEQYRGKYMKDVMFEDVFDDYYVTADIGFKKNNPRFFEAVLKDLASRHRSIQPSDVLFFDDSQSKVDAALDSGLSARLFTNVDDFKSVLSREGITFADESEA